MREEEDMARCGGGERVRVSCCVDLVDHLLIATARQDVRRYVISFWNVDRLF